MQQYSIDGYQFTETKEFADIYQGSTCKLLAVDKTKKW